MAHLVIVLPAAERDLVHLEPALRRQVFCRLAWLADNAPRVIHHAVANMPSDLARLCRFRVGNCRIIYWVYPDQEILKIYRIQHRQEVYRDL
jgi:mRNA-degrading endonuclease RelE of RelBE toxin-antitoxin system